MTESIITLARRAEYWAIPAAIAAAAASLQLSFAIPLEGGGSYEVMRASILVMPMIASGCCFVVALRYEISRIFGRSFLMLGAAYAVVSVGEAIYYFYLDPAGIPEHIVTEVLFLAAYPLFVAHVLINITYFVQNIGRWWLLPCGVVLAIAPAYAFWTGMYFPYIDILTVVCSSALLGLVALAFVMFYGTALSRPWLLLLTGIFVGTIGDVLYRHAHVLGEYGFENPSTGLWAASHMLVIYALYRHCKTF